MNFHRGQPGIQLRVKVPLMGEGEDGHWRIPGSLSHRLTGRNHNPPHPQPTHTCRIRLSFYFNTKTWHCQWVTFPAQVETYLPENTLFFLPFYVSLLEGMFCWSMGSIQGTVCRFLGSQTRLCPARGYHGQEREPLPLAWSFPHCTWQIAGAASGSGFDRCEGWASYGESWLIPQMSTFKCLVML